MAQGIIIEGGSESIHKYRDKIAAAATDLKNQLVKTQRAIDDVSEQWKDEKFNEFQTNFEEDKAKIQPLCDVLKEYVDDKLFQFENHLRDYEASNPHL